MLKELCVSWVTILGQDSWKLGPEYLGTFPHVLFPFVDFTLYIYAIINPSSELNYILSPVYPLKKLPNLEVVLGTSDTANSSAHS
jgi:hypothetical protein